MRVPVGSFEIPTLGDRFVATANGVGFLRLLLAASVLISHVGPLGFGKGDVGLGVTHGQTSLGALGVDGFFVLSGFLIAGSGRRLGVGRFAWHRFLRIFPGLWACLIVTALLIAPVASLIERGTLTGFFGAAQGPFGYVAANWWSGIRQWTISGLLSTTPYGRVNPWGGSGFDGSLWSLIYELTCYALVGVLAVTLVLRRLPWITVVLALCAYGVIVSDYARGAGRYAGPIGHGTIGPLPLIGQLDTQSLIYLGFLFLLGTAARLYAHRLPVHPAMAAVAAGVLLATMAFGGFYVIGLPMFAYLMLWAACRLPERLHGVGRRHDYSYGIYIYAFPVQQVLALAGVPRAGAVGYTLLSMAITMIFAVASWHVVERPAMSLRNWRPGWRRPRQAATPVPTVVQD